MKKRIEFYTDQELDNSSNLYNYDARLYDPVIGRFVSPDTAVPDFEDLDNSFSFDPQMLNRYAYCRNNPLIYIDPTGHFLYLNGTEDEREKILQALREIDPSVKVNNVGTNTVKVSFDSEVSFEGHEKGHELVSNLVTSDHTHVIMTTEGGNGTEGPASYKEGGGGTDSKIKYNPDLKRGETGTARRPAFIGLAHELGHSEAIDNGTQSLVKTPKRPGTTPPSERNSLKRENEVRKEHKLRRRRYYYPKSSDLY